MHVAGEDMVGKPKKDPLAGLMALPGVGKATAKKLSDAGIKSATGINKAGAKGLAKAGLSATMSKKLLTATSIFFPTFLISFNCLPVFISLDLLLKFS